jgi:hypothetical protein
VGSAVEATRIRNLDMASYWIKLYLEILEDPKMATLPDRLWRRFTECCLLAGKFGEGGNLPDTTQLAWILRLNTDDLNMDLQQLASTGMIAKTVSGWLVVNFAKRQAPVPAEERYREFRNKNPQYVPPGHKRNSNEVKTPRLEINRLTDKSNEIETEEKQSANETFEERFTPPSPPPPSFSSIDTGKAKQAFGDNRAQDSQTLYCKVTSQTCIPGEKIDEALHNLSGVLDYFQGDVDRALPQGKAIYAEWCNTPRKNGGGTYSPTNTGWINRWLSRLAEIPKQDTITSELERYRAKVRMQSNA